MEKNLLPSKRQQALINYLVERGGVEKYSAVVKGEYHWGPFTSYMLQKCIEDGFVVKEYTRDYKVKPEHQRLRVVDEFLAENRWVRTVVYLDHAQIRRNKIDYLMELMG